MSADPTKLTPAAAGGFLPWLPWIGAVIVVGAVGASAGVLGVFGTPSPVKASSAIVLGTGINALDCPDGAPVAQLAGGERVLALKRSDDSRYLQVRNPYDINQLVWLPAGLVLVDKHQLAIGTLDVAGCPTPTASLDPLPVAPVIPVAPVPGKPSGGHAAPPPKDTTKPIIIKANASPAQVINGAPATLSVVATDNVAVTSVTVTWSGEESGSGSMHLVSGTWQLTFSSSTTSTGDIHFVFVARDAAGNPSAPAAATVNHQFLG